MERYPSGQREQTVNLPAYAFEGSNPSLSTMSVKWERTGIEGGNSSVGRASAFQAEGRGFESRFPLHEIGPGRDQAGCFGRAHVAQSVEHFLGKEEVTGSNPVMSSNIRALWLPC